MMKWVSSFILTAMLFILTAANAQSGDSPDAEDTPQEKQYRQGTPPGPLRPLDFMPFEAALSALTPARIAQLDDLVIEATVATLQGEFETGALTAEELVTYYIYRIRALDVNGLRSINELNPDALTIARQLDAERANGQLRGALHGIPVIVKDNIATGDSMHNTAGAAAMREAHSPRDAFIVGRLRDSGAVILAKANMSEWAYFMFENGPSGYSTLGGQVVNAYDPAVDPFGSSTGSAVGISANLATLSIGTETAGSVIAPAARTSTVGIHPSLGLLSRDLIIPLTDQLDTAGPITRTVTDAALMLTIMMGVDERDPMTQQTAPIADADFTQFLDPNALVGRRVGVIVRGSDKPFDEAIVELQLTEAINALRRAGAEVIGVEYPGVDALNITYEQFASLLHNGTRMGMASYLAQTESPGINSMADVVAFNNTDPDRYAFYGQEHLVAASESSLTEAEYLALAEEMRTNARTFIHNIYSENEIDVLVTVDNTFSFNYAVAGYPAITVPGGFVDTRPFGVTFVGGDYLTDAMVISYAYAFEVNSLFRRPPASDD